MGGRVIATCVCVLAAGLAGLCEPPSAQAAEKAIWGPAKLPSGASAFPVYRDLGVDTIQFQLDFATVAPTAPAAPGNPGDPAYRWPSDLDATIAEARANGIEVALLVNQIARVGERRPLRPTRARSGGVRASSWPPPAAAIPPCAAG